MNGDGASPVPTYNLYIDGQWIPAESGQTFTSTNPADTRDVIGRFQVAEAHDVARAVGAAERAFATWRLVPAPRRGELMYRFAQLLADRKEVMARALSREMGKILEEARGDVQEGIDIAFLMAGEGRRMFGDTVPSELPNKWAMSTRAPRGVAAIITPWNFPIAVPCWKIMPALITGNTVVFKPASATSHCATLLVQLLEEAGFPNGTINLVTGSGAVAGDCLVTSPQVKVISFTGSTEVGRTIAASAGGQLKRLALELGGKNALAIMDDADLELAAEGITWAAFGTTGQRCTSLSRLVVQESILEELLTRVVDRATALRLGPGLDPLSDMGPLIDEAALTKVDSYVQVGLQKSSLVCGGRRSTRDGLDHGYFYEPTVFRQVRPEDRIAQEEIFGPVLAVIAVRDYEEAVAVVNSTPFGLSSGIYTQRVDLAFRAIRDFETGIVYVNGGTIGAETHLPFGGMKDTGNGQREAGHAALDTYTEWKAVYVDYSGRLQRAQIDNQPSTADQ
jgi:acyl-CoA reductase-like NAD-dependent aldehyde dehydrogenase